ncbi:hypothetical protein TIFTF001_055253, partial [Ficus carica]
CTSPAAATWPPAGFLRVQRLAQRVLWAETHARDDLWAANSKPTQFLANTSSSTQTSAALAAAGHI